MHTPSLAQALMMTVVAFMVTQVATLSTSIYLHRTIAHRALVMNPLLRLVFRTLLWLTTGQMPKEWVAVHRKHHAYTDRPGDPHSPRLLGLWRVHLFNVLYYAREARNRGTLQRFAPDVVEDVLDRLIFSRGLVGLAACAVLLSLALGLRAGVGVMIAHGILYVFLIAPLVNGLGHWNGKQNFANTAYNHALLALVTGGESLHNNHHASPYVAKFSIRPLEFDPAWPIIRTFEILGLISIVFRRAKDRTYGGEHRHRPLTKQSLSAGQQAPWPLSAGDKGGDIAREV